MFECLMFMFVCPTSFAGSQRLHRTAVGLCAKNCVLSFINKSGASSCKEPVGSVQRTDIEN